MKLLYPTTLEAKYYAVQAVFTDFNKEDSNLVYFAQSLEELRAFCTLNNLVLPVNIGELVTKDRMGFSNYLILKVIGKAGFYGCSYYEFTNGKYDHKTKEYVPMYPELNATVVGKELLTIYKLCTTKATEDYPNPFEDIQSTGFGQFYEVNHLSSNWRLQDHYPKLYWTNYSDKDLEAGKLVKVDPKDFIAEDAVLLLNSYWAQDENHIVLLDEDDLDLSLVQCTEEYPNWEAVEERKSKICVPFTNAIVIDDVRKFSDKELIKRYLLRL